MRVGCVSGTKPEDSFSTCDTDSMKPVAGRLHGLHNDTLVTQAEELLDGPNIKEQLRRY